MLQHQVVQLEMTTTTDIQQVPDNFELEKATGLSDSQSHVVTEGYSTTTMENTNSKIPHAMSEQAVLLANHIQMTLPPIPYSLYCVGLCCYHHDFIRAVHHELYSNLTDKLLSHFDTNNHQPTTGRKAVVFATPFDNVSQYKSASNMTTFVAITGEPHDYSSELDPGFDVMIEDKFDIGVNSKDFSIAPLRYKVPTFYVPFYVSSMYERRHHTIHHLLKSDDEQERIDRVIVKKSKFAAYLTSNCLAYRDNFFEALSTYKPVDAIGKCKHNTEVPPHTAREILTDAVTFYDTAVELFDQYKFVISFENTPGIPGYITEKLVNPMLAGAIPIYFGAPDVAEHFNTRSFVDAQQYLSLDTSRNVNLHSEVSDYDLLVDVIRSIDQNDTLYHSMLQESWLVNNTYNTWMPDRMQPNNRLLEQFTQIASM
jgi:hypothetical protein